MPGKTTVLLILPLLLIAGCISPFAYNKPVQTPATGSLAVTSDPPGAEVYLDNVYQGTTPVTVNAAAGSYTLELRLRDYQVWSQAIGIYAGTPTTVSARLDPVPVETTPAATAQTTRPATLPTTRPRPTTPTPEPTPRSFLGCFRFDTYGHTGTGEEFNFTEIWWFQPAGVGLANGTWTYAPPKKTERTLDGFTWSRDFKTGVVSVYHVGEQELWAEITYNANNDTITFKNVNMRTIFVRAQCW